MNIKEYLDGIEKEKGIYIFGAGKAGRVLSSMCLDRGIHIDSFIVSDTDQNESSIKGIPVIQYDDDRINHDRTVMIAVLERGRKEIEDKLRKAGFINIVPCYENILEHDPLEIRRARSPIIEITSQIGCSVNCRYCPQKLLVDEYFYKDKGRKRILDYSSFKRYIDRCPENMIIDFSGFAEPFLNEDVIRMMKYACDSGHEMTLFTTLKNLSAKCATEVVSMPFSYVCLHLPDIHGYANIDMTDEYFEALDIFLDAKKKDGRPFVDNANSQFEPHPDVVERIKNRIRIYCEMVDRAGALDGDDVSLKHSFCMEPLFCMKAVGVNHNVLLPDGSLVLCCNDFGLRHVIGSLEDNSYEDVMQGEVIKNIKKNMKRRGVDDLICRKCVFAHPIS